MKKIEKQSIGIFGGSFDPPHKGHIHIARLFIKKLKLKKLIWSVSEKNPLLKKKYFYSYKERMSLSKNIVKKFKKIIVNESNKKYSFQLVNFIKKKYHNKKLFFLIGTDNVKSLHKWKNLPQLMNCSTLVIINRPGYKKELKKSVFFRKYHKFLLKKYDTSKIIPQKSWIYIKDKGIKISSSSIKNRLYKTNN